MEVLITPDTITSIGEHMCSGCTSLKYFIVKSGTPPTLGSYGAGKGSPIQLRAGGHIYVPDASVESYKTATNWSSYSDVIKGISELITDNPDLYSEISAYLSDVMIDSGFVVAPSSKSTDESTIQLYAYYNGESVNASYEITSSVATIDSNGLITFTEEGTAEVTATYNGNTLTRTYTYNKITILSGFELDKTGANVANKSMSIVGFVPCRPSTKIKWGVTSGTLGTMCEFNEAKTLVDYWTPQSNPRTITAASGTRYVKAAFQTSRLDYAYIYDVTNVVYLWKGINVT